MAEVKNPLTERVKKMAAILRAAKEAGERVEKEKEAKGQGGRGQSGPSS